MVESAYVVLQLQVDVSDQHRAAGDQYDIAYEFFSHSSMIEKRGAYVYIP
jgi:hypothetical protein